MDKNKILVISIIGIILIIIIYIKNTKIKEDNYEQLTFNEITTTKKDVSNSNEEISEKIKIHMIGEINNPGLIELEVGSRIYDAIELAGGLTSQADTSKTNLAYILSDGEKIYIPNINDEEIVNEHSLGNYNTKININTANSQELQTIPGVGESTANSIIAYRNQNRKIYYN